MIFQKMAVHLFTLLLLCLFNPQRILSFNIENIKTPPNTPAQFLWNGKTIQLTYNNQIIFKAEIQNSDEQTAFNDLVDNNNGKINQVLKWTSREKPLKLAGQIFTSEESFPCESDRKREGPDIVRHSVGLSHSLLNRAVYERKFDWVISVDFPSQVEIIPEKSSSDSNIFKIIITGRDIIVRFRPFFYQKHRGLTHFQPWTYQVWKKPVVGWCSWFAYFKDKNLDLVEVYRNFEKAIQEEIGEENFMLGCWGIRPELVGIIDGCRIGGDGFGYAGLAQYTSFNNVVWRNDPDHIELSPEEAYRSCMVTSLTGSLFMLTDKPEVYMTEIVEPAKRTVPVLFTLPGQIYDVDPSRSSQLHLVDSELSGDEIRFFDSDRTPRCHLFLMEINKPFENWMLLGRTGGDLDRIRFKHLGLPEEKEYLVFEFWKKKLIGSFVEEFSMGEIDPKYNSQLFCIRERKLHPQIIATNRHITCGGFDLNNMIWQENTLSGESELVGKDSYTLYLTEPLDYQFKEVMCEGAEISSNQKKGMTRIIQLRSEKNSRVNWIVKYD